MTVLGCVSNFSLFFKSICAKLVIEQKSETFKNLIMHMKSKSGTCLELDSGKSNNFLANILGGKWGKSYYFFVIFICLKVAITELFEFYGLCFSFRNILLPENSEIAIYISMKKKKMTDPCMLELYKYDIWEWSLKISLLFFYRIFN